MLSKDIYIQKMKALSIAFGKKQNSEYEEFIYDKLSKFVKTDLELIELFDRLYEVEKYPRLGMIKSVYREMKLRLTKKGLQGAWYYFICSCGECIVLEYQQLLNDPSEVISCKSTAVNKCDRHFSKQKLLELAKDKPPGSHITIPIDGENDNLFDR